MATLDLLMQEVLIMANKLKLPDESSTADGHKHIYWPKGFLNIPASELASGVKEIKSCSRCGGLMVCKRFMPNHLLFQCQCCGAVRRHEVSFE